MSPLYANGDIADDYTYGYYDYSSSDSRPHMTECNAEVGDWDMSNVVDTRYVGVGTNGHFRDTRYHTDMSNHHH